MHQLHRQSDVLNVDDRERDVGAGVQSFVTNAEAGSDK
jgi:hypothetical protein